MVVMAGDAQRLTEIVCSRRNLHHSGSTAGTSLQECMKSTLKGIPVLPTAEKHKLLGNARCKDDSRSTCDAKGLDLSFVPCRCPIVNDVNDAKMSMTLLMVTLTSHNSFCFRP